MASSKRLALALAALLATAHVALPASAEPSLADLAQARELRNEGRKLRDAGDLPGALDKFKAAHALGQTPVTGIELARTHALMKHLVEAREVCLAIRRTPVASDETHLSKEARDEAGRLAEELKPRIPTLTVRVTGAPPGMAPIVILDGTRLPDAAIAELRFVDPGHHDVVAKVEGGPEAQASVELGEGETKEVTLAVQPPPPPPPPHVEPPPPHVEPPPIRYEPPPPPDRSRSRTFLYSGIAVTSVGALVGTVAGLVAMNNASQLSSACPGHQCLPDQYSLLDSSRTLGTTADVAFGVAGVGVVMIVYGLLSDPGGGAKYDVKAASSARVAPFVGVGSAGIHGSF